jgi:hypothetical protein
MKLFSFLLAFILLSNSIMFSQEEETIEQLIFLGVFDLARNQPDILKPTVVLMKHCRMNQLSGCIIHFS